MSECDAFADEMARRSVGFMEQYLDGVQGLVSDFGTDVTEHECSVWCMLSSEDESAVRKAWEAVEDMLCADNAAAIRVSLGPEGRRDFGRDVTEWRASSRFFVFRHKGARERGQSLPTA